MNFRSSSTLLAGAFALTLAATSSQAATVLFDNMTAAETGVAGAALTATSSTPNTFMGDGYILAAGASTITGFDLFPVNSTAATTYTNLKLNVYVWGTVNTGTVNATTPAFSNLLGSYSFTTAASTFSNTGYYAFEGDGVSTPGVSLTTPLTLTGITVGLSFNIQGSTNGGVTYASANNLTSLISYGAAPTVGAEVFNGYYRNAASEANGNFTSATRSLGLTYQSVAVRVYGDVTAAVPEPSTYLLTGLGLAALMVLRRRKQR